MPRLTSFSNRQLTAIARPRQITDPPPAPVSAAITAAADNIDEGSALTFTVTTSNIQDLESLSWRILDNPGDFTVSAATATLTTSDTEQEWTSPGTYQFTVPAGVTLISALVIGGGGAGHGGGAGGTTTISRTGPTVLLSAGGGAAGAAPFTGTSAGGIGSGGGTVDGVLLGGGSGGAGSGGGDNSNQAGGAGGAGGYSGNGGAGGNVFSAGGAGSGGGGAGGGGGSARGDSGGGTGIYGEGSSGTSAGSSIPGGGGSGGSAGLSVSPFTGGLYGGGGSVERTGGANGGAGGALRWINALAVTPGETLTVTVGAGGTAGGRGAAGGHGAARIVWGVGRAFPATNVGRLPGTVQFTVTPAEDLLTEGPETFRVAVYRNRRTLVPLAISDAITINDTSSATITITPQSFTLDEGDSLTVDVAVDSQNLPDGTTLYWSASSPNDVTPSSGSFVINSDAGSFSLAVRNDLTTEGTETFTVSVRSVSTTGTIMATSSPITINDTSVEIYGLTPRFSTINEGGLLVFDVSTSGVPNGTELYWTASSADIDPVSGSFTINNGSGAFAVTAAADATTEGSETFTVSLRTGSVSGTVVATSSTITINDTSLTPIYTLTSDVDTLDEGQTVTFNLATQNVDNLTEIPYTISGQVSEDDVDVPLTGTITVTGVYSNSFGSLAVTLREDYRTENDETLTLTLDVTGSPSKSVTVSSTTNFLDLLYTFSDPITDAPTEFGNSLAVTDDYVVVGAWRTNSNRGRVYVYRLSTGTIVNTAYSFASGVNPIVNFGISVAASGNYFWAGAPRDSVTGNPSQFPGSAYQFLISGNSLIQERRLAANFYGAYNQGAFGLRVDANDSYVFLSVPLEGKFVGGSEYSIGGWIAAYDHSGNNTMATFNNTTENGQTGSRIAIAPGTSTAGVATDVGSPGRIHIASMTSTALTTFSDSNNVTITSGSSLKYEVAYSGDYIAVGDPAHTGATYSQQGRVYVYDNSGNTVATIENPVPFTDTFFGTSVAFNSNYLAVGAKFAPSADPVVARAGRVYLFDYNWRLQHTIESPDSSSPGFGAEIAMTDTRLVVARVGDTGGSTWEGGEVYVFAIG